MENMKNTVKEEMAELQRYKALGTIESVAHAVEMRKAKRVLHGHDNHYDKLCPSCGYVLYHASVERKGFKKPSYCCNCGQKLDWFEEKKTPKSECFGGFKIISDNL